MLDRLPPQADGNDIPGSLARMYDYMFYLREETKYQFDLIHKQMEENTSAADIS